MSGERQVAALLLIAAEASFFSAVFGASLVLKRAGAQTEGSRLPDSFWLCAAALIGIVIVHAIGGLILRCAQKEAWKGLSAFFWGALACMAAWLFPTE